MKNIIIILMLLATSLCSSCVKEELETGGNIPEGESALVSLTINTATMGSNPKSRAADPNIENKIENLRIIIFDKKGRVLTNKMYGNNPPTTLSVNTYSGENLDIYVIANVTEAINKKLAQVTYPNKLRLVVATAEELNYGFDERKPLVMTGKVEKVSIRPGTSNLSDPIQLHFMASKVTLVVKDNTPSDQEVTVLGWSVVDLPRMSYVLPYYNSEDAVKNYRIESSEYDKYWITETANFPFESVDANAKSAMQDLYVFENRAGTREPRSLPSDESKRYPGMDVNDGDHRGKAWFKPVRASAIILNGMHRDSEGNNKRIKAYIYLGNDNHSDYNINRGVHYTFTVTINGLDQIDIDSSVDYQPGDLNVLVADESLTMDAHPDFRPFELVAANGNATIEIVDNVSWLKVSPLDLYRHQIRQGGENGYWQQPGAINTFVRPKYIPHKSYRDAHPSGANNSWWAEAIARTDGGNGKSDDDELTFSEATHRMAYKITDIPFNQGPGTTRALYVYADENLSKAERSATVKITFLKKGLSEDNRESYIFTVKQKGYLSVYNENNSDAGLHVLNEDGSPSDVKSKFIFEQLEEYSEIIYSGIPPEFQKQENMIWGYRETFQYHKNDKYRNGYFTTVNAVYTDVVRDNNKPTLFGKTEASYRDMYGNKIATPIPNYTGATTGAPYYIASTISKEIYHPIFNSSAPRYCHEKNRDLNGDGIIDESETHWYMPSVHELSMMSIAVGFAGDEDLGDQLYWTSSQAFQSGNESNIIHVAALSYPMFFSYHKYYAAKVRCVRNYTGNN